MKRFFASRRPSASRTTPRVPHRQARLRRPLPEGRYRFVRRRWHVLLAVLDTCGWCLRLVWGWLRGRSADADAEHNPQRILVVQWDHLGDCILSLPLLRALKRRWPAAELHVLCGAWNAPLVRHLPEVDRVFAMQATRWSRPGSRHWVRETLRWIRPLRAARYDLAIDVRGDLVVALFLWAIAARARLGWRSGGGDFLLTHRARYAPRRHEIDSRRALAAAFDPRLAEGVEPAPRLNLPPAPLRIQRQYIVAHIAAGTPAKQWPVEHWHQLLRRLATRHDMGVVLIGGAADRAIARQILEDSLADRVVDLVGRLDLWQLAGLLREAAIFVGPDSGPAHLAAAAGTATVVLFSGTNEPSVWQPRGRRVFVLQHRPPCAPCHRPACPLADHPCMRGLSPARVADLVERLLQPAWKPLCPDKEVSRDRADSLAR